MKDESFLLQQGFELPAPEARPALLSALLFQPRVVSLWFLAASALQSGYAMLALAAALWWSAVVPTHNLFDLIGRLRIGPAPAPRRFAQAVAGTLAAVIGGSLLGGATYLALAASVLFAVAVALMALQRFCLGSFLYFLVRGRFGFALRTTPWSRSLAACVELPASCG
jgi:uncharacterized protein DUF4395